MGTLQRTVWRLSLSAGFGIALLGLACLTGDPRAWADAEPVRIVLLHHSTGECVWNGGVPEFFRAYHAAHGTRYEISEQAFPKDAPYGWENYPFDYWNIWVKHAGPRPYRDEPTLEILTRRYDVIVFKHCFPVSAMEADLGQPDVSSADKRRENYELQYLALRKKLRAFPETRFVVWTGAALGAEDTDPETAGRARDFSRWVLDEWDEKGDNVWIWDFRELETQGGLYLRPAHATGPHDAHPNETFSRTVAPFLGQRIVDVIEGRGDTADITGRGTPPPPPVPTSEPEPESESAPEPESEAQAPPSTPLPRAPEGKAWVLIGPDVDGQALWGAAARHATDAGRRVTLLDFRKGAMEDWGEYGRHRVLKTRAGTLNHDVAAYRYLVVRARADRAALMPLGLVTAKDPAATGDQPYFTFTAYVDLDGQAWQTLVFDLSALELAVEGPSFYEGEGKPIRPKRLSALQLVVHEKHERAEIFLDELRFLTELPAALRPHLRRP